MRIFQQALLLRGSHSTRASILDDLGTYYGMPTEECVERCRGWEKWSVEEWRQAQEAADPLGAFYASTHSWSFDLSWYAYLQAEGCAYPVSVAIAQMVACDGERKRHLDFGSGIGATSQLFAAMGWESEMADISSPLMDFARFRWERRGLKPEIIDLNTTPLPEAAYDVITAIDTLVHVPYLAPVLENLHRALKPGGLLFANFDVRPKTEENALFLYDNDLPLRWKLQRAGFEPEESLDGMITQYRWVESAGAAHALRGVRDAVLLRSPLRPAYRTVRSAVRMVVPGARAHAEGAA